MKASRLMLQEDSSSEGGGDASRGHTVVCPRDEVSRGEIPEVTPVSGEETLEGEKLRTAEVRSTPVVPRRASKEDKGKAVSIEDLPQRQTEVLPLLQYLDWKREKYAEGIFTESYVEVIRSRTRAKVAAAAEVAAKERRSQLTEAKY
ncbi:hypothetical protein AXG93_3671s1160 [Marchantia polymorpha subsp. ruderalis]|uniref:Uncharacterized protein n=1 Tax=Marchantia polymorpha subsp. ruderalis TaxID=1480154 RepID=A0A176WGZ6_MARPO|nr:hypothetical protein AXG93_3671s1160 [Marchantia polymorpha subsp. ruderalis]